ncbi:hypothetical protein [Lactococcus lactis]|nr:hypothetical protein [Lactococcus lactis]
MKGNSNKKMVQEPMVKKKAVLGLVLVLIGITGYAEMNFREYGIYYASNIPQGSTKVPILTEVFRRTEFLVPPITKQLEFDIK